MREILFRGRSLIGNEWIEGDLSRVVHDDGRCYVFPVDSYDGPDFYEVDPGTVGEFTGLTDKNSVKIFEGDIVESEDKIIDGIFWFQVCFGICGGTQNVLHEVGYMGFYLQPVGETAKKYACFGIRNDIVFWIKQKEGIKVIGNIHDNPELLEGGCKT